MSPFMIVFCKEEKYQFFIKIAFMCVMCGEHKNKVVIKNISTGPTYNIVINIDCKHWHNWAMLIFPKILFEIRGADYQQEHLLVGKL